LYKENTALRLF